MDIVRKLERKFGRFSIHNLMLYIVVMYGAGAIIDLISPGFYSIFLSLDVQAVLRGQIWRLVTFIIRPPSGQNLFFTAIELLMYYSIGSALERQWGAFRFNLYYLSGFLLNVLFTFAIYFIYHVNVDLGLLYVNRALFLAFAFLYPNVQFLIMFIIPVKVKWLGILYGAYYVYLILVNFILGNYVTALAILISLANFFVFFITSFNFKRYSPKEYKRKREFRQAYQYGTATRGQVMEFPQKYVITRHKCAVCGRTELDDEDLEFRFCSKCDGDYEYCSEHIFTHEHVKKISIDDENNNQ